MALADRLRSGTILVAPGVYDPLSARIAEAAGCEAIFLSGAALALTQLACPDFGLNSQTELADSVARICDRVAIPLIVDGDSGYGNAAHLQRLVRALGRAGAAAVQIEDQVSVKPASALKARPLVTVAEMVGKIRAAQDARVDDAFLISARTDALSSRGIEEALDRAAAYVEAGCDLLFVESLASAGDAERLVAAFGGRVPLVHNLLETGGSPFPDALAAGGAGFSLALFPVTALGAAATGLKTAYAALAQAGSSAGVRDQLTGMAELNRIVGTDAFAAAAAHYGDAG